MGAEPIPNRAPPPSQRLAVDSEPTLHLTKIAVNVHLRSHEAADPDLKAALVMFRRAANQIARVEDALVFNGRPGNDLVPPSGIRNPDIYRVTGLGPVAGLFIPTPGPDRRSYRRIPLVLRSNTTSQGQPIVTAVVDLINDLETKGQLGPYACVLGQNLFHDVCDPTSNLVLPRDRILPFLQGPLLRSSAILPDYGVVLALSGSPVELVVASDIHVRFLQTSLEPRFVFRVSERVALRIKDDSAVGIMRKN